MSKKLICVNPKAYSLTKGKDYSNVLHKTTDKKYIITNDNGIVQSYSTKLFEVEEEKIQKIKVSLNDIISYFSISDSFGVTGSNISCGIEQYYNVNGLANSIDNINGTNNFQLYFENHELNSSPEITISRLKECLFAYILYKTAEDNGDLIQENGEHGMVLLSTNISDNIYYELISSVLDPISVLSNVIVNANSHNEIKLWVLNSSEIDSFEGLLNNYPELEGNI